MRILFGPERDALHIDPAAPGAYEWWYFDALSDDGHWALVVIFFLGSPMSPYYRTVASGEKTDPRDWCGVFVSLHERRESRWRERAYAYNLYRNGEFSAKRPETTVGGSRMIGENAGWRLDVDEPGLWRGRTRAHLRFAPTGAAPDLPPMGEGADHTWVCVAPHCRVFGAVTCANGEVIPFHGNGYHDHNFGRLPFDDTDIWYWGRARLDCDDGKSRDAVFYHLEEPENRRTRSVLLLFGPNGEPLVHSADTRFDAPSRTRSAYGLVHHDRLILTALDDRGAETARLGAVLLPHAGVLSEAPFYRRLEIGVRAGQQRGGTALWSGEGRGIGEVFRPAKLCGPIVSRAIWSRVRRRKK